MTRVLLAYVKLIPLLFISCKDFRNWNSIYTDTVNIAFEQEGDPLVPNTIKDLHSEKMKDRDVFIHFLHKEVKREETQLHKKTIPLSLIPDDNKVQILVRSSDESYYHQVIIHYERVVSLISPQAGGLQQKYIIKSIDLEKQEGKKTIFKGFKINDAVPLEENKHSTHVTIYY